MNSIEQREVISCTVVPEGTVVGTLDTRKVVEGAVGIGGITRELVYPKYEGSYSVIPEMGARVLPTRETTVEHDIVVAGVPAYRVSNDFGETFTIG